jgi:hypothetical protein
MKYTVVIPTFLSGLILGFGLVSCSPDKSEKIEVQKDNWPTPMLNVVQLNKSSRQVKNLNDQIDTSDSLEFVFEDSTLSNSIVSLDIENTCTAFKAEKNGELKESAPPNKFKYSAQQTSSFRLIDTLSDELLVRRDPKLRCDYKIRIKNEIGSTKTFELNRLLINRSDNNWVEIFEGNKPIEKQGRISITRFDSIRFLANSTRGLLTMNCNHITTMIHVEHLPSVHFSDLALQPVKLPEGQVADTRRLHPFQTCTFVFRGPAPTYPVSVSQPVDLDFGAPALGAKLVQSTASPFGSSRPVFFEIQIQNPNPYPISIRVPRSFGRVSLSGEYYQHGAPEYGVRIDEHVSELELGVGPDVHTIPAAGQISLPVVVSPFKNPCRVRLTNTLPFTGPLRANLLGLTAMILNPDRFTLETGVEFVEKPTEFAVHSSRPAAVTQTNYFFAFERDHNPSQFTKGYSTDFTWPVCVN